jgi:hypothetical protein
VEEEDVEEADMGSDDDLDRATTPDNREDKRPRTESAMSKGAAIENDVWETYMLPQAKEIIVQSMLSAWEKIEWRKNGVGIFGFDLMPDNTNKLWLLEINKCPTMELSTHVTKQLVPRFLEDLAELMMYTPKN